MKFKLSVGLLPLLTVTLLQVETCSFDDETAESANREEPEEIQEIRREMEERGSDREKENMLIVNDRNRLNKRISQVDEPVKFRNTSGKEAETGPRGAHFIHLADVRPPETPSGDKLSATCVQIIDHYAYVSWHLNKGPEDYYGALEIYDLNDPGEVKLRSAIVAEDIDFNHLYADAAGNKQKRKLWAVGSERPAAGKLSSPAFMGEFAVDDERFMKADCERTDLVGFSGNCVIKHGDDLFHVSGNSEGAVTRYNPNMKEETMRFQAEGLKYLSVNDTYLVILVQGRPSSRLLVYQLPVEDFNRPQHSVLVGAITPENGKNVAYLNGDSVYIATGKLGMKVFDIRSKSQLPVYTYNTLLPGSTNGVSADDEFVYVANGSSGLHVLHKDDYMLLGNFSYEGSANFVTSNNRYVIVANGRGGLKILRRDK